MCQHPSAKIMTELIQKQWTKHSIYAAVINEKAEIISIGRTTVTEENDPLVVYKVSNYARTRISHSSS
ncbi:hypothetical protein [Candidatus Enterococcus lemimoniae]|uniref:Uncharacterized protein n=1 Tax=Candidatus Enterococcus lemimoniae TaxID=1834167 RepID=A0ABZ2T7B9_9ENTE|nr:hypothetical protein [Enterococcus sp. 12C11_DIV0727]OTO69278.1 hypothetical protein A5866_001478 [Enterococcus sp. 12C11_DIV0727]